MRVVVVAVGTRGDVEPFVALAQGMQAAGHDVTIAVPSDAAELVVDRGLSVRELGISISEQLAADAGHDWIVDSAGRPMRELRHMRRVYQATARPLADGLLSLSGSADLFVSGILTFDSLASVAHHDGVAHAAALLCPFHPSADGRCGLTAQNPRTRRANLTRTRIARWLLSRSATQAGRLVRRDLDLPETGPKGYVRTLDTTPTVLGASPVLVPTPSDWPATVTVTGAWAPASPTNWSPSKELVEFLADGPPPIYLGFGSMSAVQPDRIRELAAAAARASGVRLVLANVGATGRDGDDILLVKDVPHRWLFPKVRGVVHHGGAGTTHAALAAGVPQLAVPHVADQPYWARRIHEERLGPKPLTLNRLTVDRLARRFTEIIDTAAYVDRAKDLADRARSEHGVTDAVDALFGD